jgi:hypothetical protein
VIRALGVVLCLVAAIAAADVNSGDRCTGKDCRVTSITTRPTTVALLPTCTAGRTGQARFTTNGAADAGGAYYECNGSVWQAVGSGASSSSSDTCTGTSCAIGPVGISTDGGVSLFRGTNGVTVGASGTTISGDFYAGGAGLAFSVGTTGVSTSKDVVGTGYVRSVGVATGSLPTCNAGLKGATETDTTLNVSKFCNGTAWAALNQGAVVTWSNVCFGTCGEDVNMTGGVVDVVGTSTRMVCSWGTAGTGGATGVVVKIRNVTDAATVCSCTIGACTIAANTPTQCVCSGAFVTGKIYAMQVDGTTDCSANPGNIVCTSTVSPTP